MESALPLPLDSQWRKRIGSALAHNVKGVTALWLHSAAKKLSFHMNETHVKTINRLRSKWLQTVLGSARKYAKSTVNMGGENSIAQS